MNQNKATQRELFPIASNQETNTIEEWISHNWNPTQHETYRLIETWGNMKESKSKQHEYASKSDAMMRAIMFATIV